MLWLLLFVVAAAAFTARQQPAYKAEAQVLIGSQDIVGTLTDTAAGNSDSDRELETQARLATAPAVARAALRSLKLKDRDARELTNAVTVSTVRQSDILVFNVVDESPQMAAKLVNAYAEAYIEYRQNLETLAVRTALSEVSERMRSLARRGKRSSTLYDELAQKQQQLRTITTLQTSNASIVRKSDGGEQIRPTPVRNIALGMVAGLITGLLLIVMVDMLDTRVRDLDEFSSIIEAPLLASLPETTQPKSGAPLMLSRPNSAAGEAFRVLKSNLEFALREKGLKTVMFTSADAFAGKSTTATNLAVAAARSGRTVALVDLDLRRPSQAEAFGVQAVGGVTEVISGEAEPAEVCMTIPTAPSSSAERYELLPQHGRLDLYPAGRVPSDPGEVIDSRELESFLDALRQRYELVLIDCSPALGFSDPLALAQYVDALVIVARVGATRARDLEEVTRLLRPSMAEKIGVVVTGSSAPTGYSKGYGSEPAAARESDGRRQLLPRRRARTA